MERLTPDSPESLAPVSSGSGTAGPRLPRDVRVEHHSQQCLDELEDPRSSGRILKQFKTELYDTHSLMRRHQPKKAAHLIAKTLRQTTYAALSFEPFVDIMRFVTPRLENGDNPLEADVGADAHAADSYHFTTGISARDVSGAPARFMHRLAPLLFGASRRFLGPAQSDPDHPYHHLFKSYVQTHWALKANPARGSDLKTDPLEAWYQGMESACGTTLELLLHAAFSQMFHTGWIPSREGMLSTLAKNLDVYAWSATSKKSFSGPVLHKNPLSVEFSQYEGLELHDVADFCPGRKPILEPSSLWLGYETYVHPSLHEGPWPQPGFCVAVPVVGRPPETNGNIVERFYLVIEDRYGHPMLRPLDEHNKSDGSFDRVTPCLDLGLLAFENTILAPGVWPRRPPDSPGGMSGSH